jgi:hypothetical protein
MSYLHKNLQLFVGENMPYLHKNLQLFVGEPMSYLRYLCLVAYRGVQHILFCVFVLFFFVLITTCCQFLWIVHS